MRNRCAPTFLLLVTILAITTAVCSESPIAIWPVDPLTKVFPNTPAEATTKPVVLIGGRNEYVSAQVAVRSSEPVSALTVRWERPVRWQNTYPSRLLAAVACTFPIVGYSSKNQLDTDSGCAPARGVTARQVVPIRSSSSS